MYFRDRTHAGQLLAKQLARYRFTDTALVALSSGGVQVAEQIARELHSGLSILVTAKITALGEPSFVLGAINQEGDFNLNEVIPTGEMEEYLLDMWGYLEEEKLHKLYDMAQLLDDGGLAKREKLHDKVVIIVSDGVKTGMSFDAALHFLKPVHTKKIIGAIPVGPAEVVERLAQEVDEMHYLYIPDNFFTVGHYYEDNTPINSSQVIAGINHMATRWH